MKALNSFCRKIPGESAKSACFRARLSKAGQIPRDLLQSHDRTRALASEGAEPSRQQEVSRQKLSANKAFWQGRAAAL